MAVTAVIFVAMAAMLFATTALGAAVNYADSVALRQKRIQAKLNLKACEDTLRLMYSADYFLEGDVYLREFDCFASVQNDFSGNFSFKIKNI